MLTHFNNFPTKIETGDHICFLNETESELRTALSHQLSQGLERDEKLLYISHANNLETVQILLKEIGVDANDYLQSGQLEIINWVDFYFSEGGFDLNKLIDRLRQETNQAIDGGYSALRVISEMTWTTQSSEDIDLLREDETSIDEFTSSNPCIFACLYDMGKFESEVLMDVLRRHPKVALNREIYENNYYILPEKIKHADPKAQELNGWLHNIIKHKRLKEQLYEGLLDRVPIGLCISTPEGKYIDVNNAFLKTLGFPDLETLSASKIEDRYINPDDRFRWMASIAKQSPLKGIELQVRKYDGTPIWVRMNAEAVKDNNDQVIFYEISQEDITDRKQAQESLRKSEKQLQDLFETMSEGVVFINPNGQIIFSNAAAHRILELEGTELEKRNIARPQREFIREDRTPMQTEDFASSLVMDELRPVNDVVIGVKHLDGSLIWINSNATPMINNEGKLEGVVSTFTDITRNKQAEEELLLSLEQIKHNQKLLLGLVRASEAIQKTRSSYQQVYKIIGEEIAKLGLQSLILTLSADGNYLELQDYRFSDSIVAAAVKLTGISPPGYRFPLKPGGFHQRLLDAGEVVLTEPGLNPINEMLSGYMRPLSKKLASIVGLDQVIYAPLIVNNQSFGILAVNGHGLSNDDIPAMKTFAAHASIAIENTLLFDAERAAHQQMVDLTNYLQVVREEERTYMAREIHDEFGQRLTALKMDISWLTNHLPTVDTAIIEKVSGMDKLVDESIQLVRQVAADLRPGLLDDLGLTAALEWQTQDFTKRSGIEYDLFFGDTDIPPVQDRDTVLFRVFQEALTNITRHSGATKITVNLFAEHDFVQLKIHDNGIGITSEALDGTKSLGLLGMRERARSLGGDVEITGNPDQGTTVLVKIPL